MFKKLFMFLCFIPLMGLAAPQASNGKDVVILRDTSCSNKDVLGHIPEEYKKYFFDADVLLKDVQYKACWILQGENVVLVYPDGDQGMLPVGLFKEAGI